MNIIRYPTSAQAAAILARPGDSGAAARREQVGSILAAVKQEGDAAIHRFARQFEHYSPEAFEVLETEITAAERELPAELKTAILQAYDNIRRFHLQQWEPEARVETMTGVDCWRKSVAIDQVGLYIPGGTAPLFSTVLMLGIPAQIAGCQEVILCSPVTVQINRYTRQYYLPPVFAASAGIFKIGGAQAIAAMAYGTESVPAVWKIFGPGNSWVTTAKALVSLEGVAIDMLAGPSEVCIVADSSANPSFIAADLLSQAEHGADSQVLLIADNEQLIQQVSIELERQLNLLPRHDFARQSLENSHALLVHHLDDAIAWANAYAPEHLILAVNNPELLSNQVRNAGSVFLGHYSPESAGDYASGTNHTLPTSGYARAYSGVSLDSFLKKITFQHLTAEGLAALAPTICTMARAEGLEAHAKAVDIRLKGIE